MAAFRWSVMGSGIGIGLRLYRGNMINTPLRGKLIQPDQIWHAIRVPTVEILISMPSYSVKISAFAREIAAKPNPDATKLPI